MRLVPLLLAAAVLPAQQHWADRAIVRPEPPAVAVDGAWQQPLDRFVLAALTARGLEPSPPAAAAAWLRRVTLDLIGLPPTPAQLDEFVADRRPAARERVVDRLLASPEYAERWTAWWLDLARYADSQGYEKDALRRSVWRWRDYVLDAFARDLPLDRFTIEQLAGDLLPGATDDQRLATAFHRHTMTNTEGGTDDEEFRVAAVVDRVDTTLSVWMGATAGCAQCHDHKHDPISQREFFGLYAFFDQTEDADRADDAPLLAAPTPAQRTRRDAIDAGLAALRARPPRGGELRPPAMTPWRQRPEWSDARVHTFDGEHTTIELQRTLVAERAATVTLAFGSDDGIAVWWNGTRVFRHDVARAAAADQELLAVDLLPGANELRVEVTNGRGRGGFWFDLIADPAEAAARRRVAELVRERDQLEQEIPRVPVLRELPPDRRRTTRLHRRGSFLDPGEAVAPHTPAVWPPLPPDAPRDRLALARWLMADANPRTARVLANRIWSELFGRGLVPTLEDFGSQGEQPSHPELLDWLACELRAGWSLRALLRTIVLSATYGQDSACPPARRERDPDNRWLARGPAFRLSAEMLRDQALAVAGLLSRKVGGPSVMPPQPDGIWRQIYSGEQWVPSTGDDAHRRSLYTFWRRTSPHPAMLVFDAPSREACVLRRQRTNTPLQALVLWNEPTFVAAARALGAQVPATDSEQQVARWLFRRCLLREPTAAEAARLGTFYREEFARTRDALLRDPAGSRLDAVDAAAGHAAIAAASVVLTLDEFVTRR